MLYAHASDCLNCSLKMGGFQGVFLSGKKSVCSGSGRERRGGGRGSKGSNEPPLEINNGGLKTQTVDFQLLANSGGMENKL